MQLEQLQAQALDTTNIDAAQADLDQKKVDLDKLEKGKGKGVVTPWELDHAKLDVKIAGLRLALARFEHEQDQRKYDEAKIHVERMNIASPIAGTVEEIFIEPGESVNALDEVIRVVKIDSLWIDVPVPLDETKNMEKGQTAEVEFDGSKEGPTNGRIIHIAGVADAASNTRTVRVEVPNTEHDLPASTSRSASPRSGLQPLAPKISRSRRFHRTIKDFCKMSDGTGSLLS